MYGKPVKAGVIFYSLIDPQHSKVLWTQEERNNATWWIKNSFKNKLLSSGAIKIVFLN